MGKYIKSHSNYIAQKKHQNTTDGVIYYHDQLSVNGISEFSNVKGQAPIFRDGNFLMTTRISNGETRSISPKRFISNSYSGNVWTDEVLAKYPTDNNSQSDTIELNFNYYSLRKFSYYGSCKELFNASLNDILKTFPAELYVLTDGTYGVNAVVSVEDSVDGHVDKVIGDNGFVNKIDNPFGIDIIKKKTSLEIEKTEINELRSFANDGFLAYNVIDRNGDESPIVAWDSNSRYWLDGTLFVGTDAEYSDALLKGEIKTCFNVGDEISHITISTERETMNIKAYKGENNVVYLLCEDVWLGYHIRPNEDVVDKWFKQLDKFESLLMPRDSNPIYTCKLELIEQNQDNGSLTSTLKSFTMPIGEGGWNIGCKSMLYYNYASQLQELGATYDELFSDNLYRSMTHESIKNMDWSVRRFFNTYDDENDYDTPQANIAKIIRLMAREFDEIKFYIDGITALNTLSYSDNETNMSDYFLSDSLEMDGWELIAPYTKTLNEWIEVDGRICYRDFSLSGDNVFYNTFCGVEYDVNEKENIVRPICTNAEFIRVGDEEIMLNEDKSIDFNGKNYQQEEINGVMGYNIREYVPYTTRYVELNGKKYYVDETTSTLTIPFNGVSTTYDIEDGQETVKVAEDQFETLTTYGIKYDGVSIEKKVSADDVHLELTINRKGNSHFQVPTKVGLESETFDIALINGVPTADKIETMGWSSDKKTEGNNGQEYILDENGEKVYLNETDFNPMDDEPYLKEFPNGSVYYISRSDNADEVVLSSNGLKGKYKANLCCLPMSKNEVLYEKIYGEPYSELKASATKILNADYATKTINCQENSGICAYIAREGYTWNLPSKVVPSTTDGSIKYVKITAPKITELPKSKGYYIDGNDWNKYQDYYKFCEANGVKYNTQSQGNFAYDFLGYAWNVSGETVYEHLEGIPNKKFISKKLVLANLDYSYKVSFTFAHYYRLENANKLPYDYYATWEKRMLNEFSNGTTYPNCYTKCLYGAQVIRKQIANYRKGDYFPVIPHIENISVRLSASDVEQFGEDIPFGDFSDFEQMQELCFLNNTLGFKSKETNNTFLDLIYNKALNTLRNKVGDGKLLDVLLREYQVKYNDGDISLTDLQNNSFTIDGRSDANSCIMYLYGFHYDTQRNKWNLESWGGYGVAFGTNNYVGWRDDHSFESVTGYLGYGSSFISVGRYLPVSKLSDEGLVPYNKLWNFEADHYPYKLDGESVSLRVIPFNGSVEGSTSQFIQVKNSSYADELFTFDADNKENFVANFSSLAISEFNSDKTFYDVLVGSVINDYQFTTNSTSFERLNINSHIVGYNSFTAQSGTFYKLYAEREVQIDITKKGHGRYSEFIKENWEEGNLWDYYRENIDAQTSNPYFYDNPKDVNKQAETKYEVVDLGWFYFKGEREVTLTDIDFKVYLTNLKDNSYKLPSTIKPLVFDDTNNEYQTEEGVLLQNLPNGIYWLSDGGVNLFANELIIKPTYKEYTLLKKGTEQKQIGEKVELSILEEEKTNVINNYYYPISECRRDDTIYKLHREFSDDADYEFNPYDSSLSPYGDGYFYKKCCIKELANGLGSMTERTPFIYYNGAKLWLCKGEDELLSVKIDDVTYSTTKTDDTFIIICETACDIQYEDVTYYRIADYNDKKTYSSSDIMYKFYKNLRLNSRQLLRKKGTIEGLESMLALFGLKSKRWYEGLNEAQQISWGGYDYAIKEYTCFTNKIEDLYDSKLAKGKIAFFNSTKSIVHNNTDSNTNAYDGLPVRYISYYKDKDGNITKNQYGEDYSINAEYKKDLYPFFDNKKQYDGDTYFQMNGGWLPIYPFRFSKDNDIMLPYMDDNYILKGLHTETLRNVRSVQTLKDLVVIPKSSLVNKQIIEVQDLDTNYALVNGGLFEIYTDSYLVNDEYGNKVEKKCSYFSVRVANNSVEIGDVVYTDDLWISDPLSYCINKDDNSTEYFVRHIDLNEQSDNRIIKIFLFTNDGVGVVPFDINNDELYDGDGELNCGITLYDNLNYNFFDVFKHEPSLYSQYFRVNDVQYSELIGNIGWEQLLLTDNDTLRVDSIVDNYKANNPHSNIANKYDNGYEYMARYNQLFKYAIENDKFNIRQYGFNGVEPFETELPYIENVGFENIISLSGSSGYSVSGDAINTRDNYNMYEDSKVHFFGNFYTNNRDCTNIFKSNHKANNKFGLCDVVDMNDGNTQFYGENPTYLALSGNVYNLSNIPCVNKFVETPRACVYTRNLVDTDDYCTDRIINNKVLDINFFTDYEYYSKNYLEKYKYIDDVLLFYLQQMIPSTTIARINYGGVTENVISCGKVFDVNTDGSFKPRTCDCGTTEPDDLTKIIVRKLPKPIADKHKVRFFDYKGADYSHP